MKQAIRNAVHVAWVLGPVFSSLCLRLLPSLVYLGSETRCSATPCHFLSFIFFPTLPHDDGHDQCYEGEMKSDLRIGHGLYEVDDILDV